MNLPTELSFNSVIEFGASVFSGALSGEVTSIIIIAVLFLILVALFFGISTVLFSLVKRFFLLIVIGFSAFFFLTAFNERLVQGLTIETIIFGIAGLLFAIIALITAFNSFASHTKKAKEEGFSAPDFNPTQIQPHQSMTSQALTPQNLVNSVKNDRSILAVLSYVIIAQFGVFSSKTISAPNETVGLIFFAVFFIGAFIFIRTTYNDYLKGILHLVIASVFGFGLSVFLGVFWAEWSPAFLLSMNYFTTDALVAFITGIAVSLLMGSKN